MNICVEWLLGSYISFLFCSRNIPTSFIYVQLLGNQSQNSSTVDGSLQRRDSARRRASAHIPPKTNHLVISGGDGYEDFRLTNSSETVGRDDSTNHLLLWRVWDNRTVSSTDLTQPPSGWNQRTSSSSFNPITPHFSVLLLRSSARSAGLYVRNVAVDSPDFLMSTITSNPVFLC